jgi:hypothetical protein
VREKAVLLAEYQGWLQNQGIEMHWPSDRF